MQKCKWHRNGTDVALQVSARMAKFAPQKRASLALLTKNIPFKQKNQPTMARLSRKIPIFAEPMS